ncbi:MAG: CBS domain-containing protein, partial [Caldilineaceae bacterium]|nr:CBS domain-containing protein [Caldilineaceae bacterium]
RLAASAYSRLPLYDGTIDNVVGVVHLKDLINLNFRDDQTTVRSIMHRVGYVPESMPVEHVLRTMQREHQNLVIVVDEYGGTSGMVTIEDLFEEIIGEFNDEFDADRAMLQLHANDKVVMRGDVHIADLNEWLDVKLPTDTYDTIGGLVFGSLGKLPVVGDTTFLPYLGSNLTEAMRSEAEAIQAAPVVENESTDVSTPEAVEPAEPQNGLTVQVERMYRNSVAEISFTVTSEQANHLRQILEQGIE